MAALILLAAAAGVLTLRSHPRPPWVLKPGPVAYRGLGTWVDIFETDVWADPESAVAEMARRGVRTIYLQTSNYSRSTPIVFPEQTGRFLEAAHDAGLSVVAWYLPGFADIKADLAASEAAIRYRSPGGDGFDSFAADIEARELSDPAERNAALLRYSRQLRSFAGDSYPLGAITPNPMRIETELGYWPGFPYEELSLVYDVFAPMDYFGAVDSAANKAGAFRYTLQGIKLIRRESADPGVPIHVIGGLAEDVTGPELEGFLKACQKGGAIGWSLYNFTTSGEADWAGLAKFSPSGPSPSASAAASAGAVAP